MDTIKLLEYLAVNAHYRIELLDLIKTQPKEIQISFLTNDSNSLKKLLNQKGPLADRSTIFQI